MFDWLFKDRNKEMDSKTQKPTPFTICPHCNKSFNRLVKAKSKCKACGQYVYKRTTIDGIEKIVTKEEATRIEKDYELYISKDLIKEKLDLYLLNTNSKKHKNIQSDSERLLFLAKVQIHDSLKRKHYGHYVNAKKDIAMVFLFQKKYIQSLTVEMEIAYINDSGIIQNQWMLTHPSLSESIDTRDGEIFEASISIMLKLKNKLNMQDEDFFHLYLTTAKETEDFLPLSLTTHRQSLQDLKNKII